MSPETRFDIASCGNWSLNRLCTLHVNPCPAQQQLLWRQSAPMGLQCICKKNTYVASKSAHRHSRLTCESLSLKRSPCVYQFGFSEPRVPEELALLPHKCAYRSNRPAETSAAELATLLQVRFRLHRARDVSQECRRNLYPNAQRVHRLEAKAVLPGAPCCPPRSSNTLALQVANICHFWMSFRGAISFPAP